MTVNDELLIARACQGDDNAFEMLVRRYEEHISKIMWRFSHNSSAHSELVHEVFVQAFLSLKKYRGDAPFINWLSAVASKTGLNWWKKQARDSRYCELHEDTLANMPQKNVNQGSEPPIASGGLHAMLAELPENDRLALTLMYYEKKNSKEIAATMGWTHTATRMRISRARRKLQQIARHLGLVWEE